MRAPVAAASACRRQPRAAGARPVPRPRESKARALRATRRRSRGRTRARRAWSRWRPPRRARGARRRSRRSAVRAQCVGPARAACDRSAATAPRAAAARFERAAAADARALRCECSRIHALGRSAVAPSVAPAAAAAAGVRRRRVHRVARSPARGPGQSHGGVPRVAPPAFVSQRAAAARRSHFGRCFWDARTAGSAPRYKTCAWRTRGAAGFEVAAVARAALAPTPPTRTRRAADFRRGDEDWLRACRRTGCRPSGAHPRVRRERRGRVHRGRRASGDDGARGRGKIQVAVEARGMRASPRSRGVCARARRGHAASVKADADAAVAAAVAEQPPLLRGSVPRAERS